MAERPLDTSYKHGIIQIILRYAEGLTRQMPCKAFEAQGICLVPNQTRIDTSNIPAVPVLLKLSPIAPSRKTHNFLTQ
ncbi:hypothetical protein DF182_06335 [Chitinophaga flava]|uniref:Uncharacterized protein n=1 Tax=Chitinophaga flava TaxID=2259036 RepID=A0A365Y0R3_9BACT|nr:hypothetical protein DF182_06335 [Chitinophaga flava]